MTPLQIERFRAEADDRLNAWRSAHQAACTHLRGCRECGAALCDEGQFLWDTADLTERGLPWRAIRRIETDIAEGDRPPLRFELLAIFVESAFILACVALGWAIAKGGLI